MKLPRDVKKPFFLSSCQIVFSLFFRERRDLLLENKSRTRDVIRGQETRDNFERVYVVLLAKDALIVSVFGAVRRNNRCLRAIGSAGTWPLNRWQLFASVCVSF